MFLYGIVDVRIYISACIFLLRIRYVGRVSNYYYDAYQICIKIIHHERNLLDGSRLSLDISSSQINIVIG